MGVARGVGEKCSATFELIHSLDKKLFTPGPLGCSASTKEAMLRDLGSRDTEFIQAISDIRKELLNVAGVSEPDWTTVLMQGSGTFAVEAVLQTSSPRDSSRVLVFANGAYGKRMHKICSVVGIDCDLVVSTEILPVDLNTVTEKLCSGVSYTTVCIVHCETSSGVMNQVEKVGELIFKMLILLFLQQTSAYRGFLDFHTPSADAQPCQNVQVTVALLAWISWTRIKIWRRRDSLGSLHQPTLSLHLGKPYKSFTLREG